MTDNSFFSIEKLIEFGMGLAVSQQMVKTMNETMQNMYVPGAMTPMQSEQVSFYYAVLDGKQSGPFSISDLSKLIKESKISKDTLLWKPGMSSWLSAEFIPEVLKIVSLIPPPIPER